MQPTRDPISDDDPRITTAFDYPFSYLCLSAFLLRWAYIAVAGVQLK